MSAEGGGKPALSEADRQKAREMLAIRQQELKGAKGRSALLNFQLTAPSRLCDHAFLAHSPHALHTDDLEALKDDLVNLSEQFKQDIQSVIGAISGGLTQQVGCSLGRAAPGWGS